jgi:hypothetical protein
MKRAFTFLIIGMILGAIILTGCSDKSTQMKIEQYAKSTIVKMGTDSIIVNAVKMQNAENKSLNEIKLLDEQWQAAAGTTDLMRSLMESECGRHLRNIKSKAPSYSEILVMDNQGANVAISDKTTDYWQGDEDKFTKSYNQGHGGLHISEAKWDESSQATIVQVSVPVKDGNNVIGALTIGLDVNQL